MVVSPLSVPCFLFNLPVSSYSFLPQLLLKSLAVSLTTEQTEPHRFDPKTCYAAKCWCFWSLTGVWDWALSFGSCLYGSVYSFYKDSALVTSRNLNNLIRQGFLFFFNFFFFNYWSFNDLWLGRILDSSSGNISLKYFFFFNPRLRYILLFYFYLFIVYYFNYYFYFIYFKNYFNIYIFFVYFSAKVYILFYYFGLGFCPWLCELVKTEEQN